MGNFWDRILAPRFQTRLMPLLYMKDLSWASIDFTLEENSTQFKHTSHCIKYVQYNIYIHMWQSLPVQENL